MRLETITFDAGDQVELEGGNYFLFLKGDDPIDVDFWHGNRKLREESAEGAEPSYESRPPRRRTRDGRGEAIGFTAVTVTSATAQTVTIGISEGEGGYNRGATNAEITGPLDGGRVATASKPAVPDQFVAKNTGGSVTLATSAENVNGVWIHYAALDGGSGNAYLRTDDIDTSSVSFINTNGHPIFLQDFIIPPGYAVYLGVNTPCAATVGYTVL